MRVSKKLVAKVVTETSAQMNDPNYSAIMVGGFVQNQTPTSQYISAHEQELGGAEVVVNLIFHAAVIAACYQQANNRTVPSMTYEDLDHVSGDDVSERLQNLQPYVHEYIHTNIESAAAQQVLFLIALAMDRVS